MNRLAIIALLMAASPALMSGALAAPNGAAVYNANCAYCHQAGGVGVPGQFPRLESRVGVIASNPEGRDFLITLLLNGMAGHVVVDNQPIMGLMPSFATLPDADIAAVLNYVSGLGKTKTKFPPFTEKQIAPQRGGRVLLPNEVAIQRANLATAKIIP